MTSEEARAGGVPAPVHAFLETSFTTIAQVDVLLHLFARGGSWSADEVGRSTGLGSGHARIALDALVVAGVATFDDGRYCVADTAVSDAAALAAVANRYRRRIVEIIMTGAARREG